MKKPYITVLRLNHRKYRDQRLTSHVFLTARALGAVQGVFTGEQDDNLIQSMSNLTNSWGGDFSVSWTSSSKLFIQDQKSAGARIIHLTMYGRPLQEGLTWLANPENLDIPAVVVVGGAKVQGFIYELSDLNVSVGNQPHSEVAALAIFLHEWFGKYQLYDDRNGSKRVIPSASRKIINVKSSLKREES